MSDHLDTERAPHRAPLGLIEQADQFAPAMAVEPGAVITAGRQKLRRRRTLATGAGALPSSSVTM